MKCFKDDCYPLAFGLPTVFLMIAVAIFWCGRHKYKNVPQTGNIIWKVTKVISYALKKKITTKVKYIQICSLHRRKPTSGLVNKGDSTGDDTRRRFLAQHSYSIVSDERNIVPTLRSRIANCPCNITLKTPQTKLNVTLSNNTMYFACCALSRDISQENATIYYIIFQFDCLSVNLVRPQLGGL